MTTKRKFRSPIAEAMHSFVRTMNRLGLVDRRARRESLRPPPQPRGQAVIARVSGTAI